MISRCRGLTFLLLALSGCAPAPPPKAVEQPKPDPTAQAWYAPAVEQLAGMSRDAQSLFEGGKFEDAGKIVTDAQPLINKVLAAPRPTLAAMEAASDLDQLYGRMLMRDGRHGWARLQFQKNVTRWKHWQPQTDETKRRLAEAQAAIAECDRKLGQ